MASSAPPQDAARRAPPPPVGLAARLMWVALLLGVVAAVVLGADDARETYGPSGDDGFGAFGRVLFTIAMLALLVLAALWALLSTRVRRGENWARIATWVLAATVSAVGLAQWLTPSAWGFVVAAVAVLGAIAVLLALPASNRYFSR